MTDKYTYTSEPIGSQWEITIFKDGQVLKKIIVDNYNGVDPIIKYFTYMMNNLAIFESAWSKNDT